MISTICAIIINELMAANVGTVMSPAYNFDSWIELYNPTEQSINLAGMYLSGRPNALTYWQLPADIGSIPAKGYKVVWLGSNDILETQAPFHLDCDGGTIYLSDQNGQLVTSADYPEAMSRTSWARKTDGGDEWGWTATPTPGASNATSEFAEKRLDAPVVSVGSQLFTGTLNVKVDIPKGTTLMYTTDGSLPTLQTDGNCQESKDGLFTVTRTTNYVFRLFQDGRLPSVPVTRSFIQTTNEYTIPIVSIVGDERYFTDPMWGIDVKGTNGITGNGRDDPVNWNQPWDRPVNFSYISPTEGMLFNQDVNVSISGGWTRSNSPRSMKLKSNKVFDGLNHLDYPFFPEQKPYIRSKTLLVRNGGNDIHSGSRFMDPALTTIIHRSGIDIDVQSFVQVAEYVNGKFKGVLNLREPNNDKFVYANWGYDDEEIDMFENDKFKNGNDEAYQRLVALSERINDEGVYDEVKTLLDIDEFTNYMAAELFIGNDDWPNNNVKAYRSQHDGRFRFVCFDLDYSFNIWDHTLKSSLDGYKWVKMVQMFLNLLQHDEYRRKFIDTFCIVGGSVFERERATAIVNELADAMRPMSQYDGKLPDNSANKIKEKLKTRVDEMTRQLQQYQPMQLSGVSRQKVQLSADTEGATLTVNGIKVPSGHASMVNGQWSMFNGYLFAPVRLEAQAPVGYTFAGWKKTSGSTVSIIGYGDAWKYYDKGELSANWHNATFNDATWSSGYAPLGYKMEGVKTTVSYGSDPQQKNPTTYFRKTFSLNAEPTAADAFLLNYQVDDGCVVWVNGQEAARVNMRSGTVNYTTFSQTYAADDPMTGTINLSPTLFKKGDNVIAVEVHNTSYTSGDLFWTGELLTTMGASSDEELIADAVIDLPSDATVSLTATFDRALSGSPAEGTPLVRINEVSPDNDIYVNEYFKRDDWVELYNTTDKPIDVEGMYLTDNPEKPEKYQITKGDTQASTIIPAHGYLIIWCDKRNTKTQLFSQFKLAKEGDELLLTAADGSWTDRFVYPEVKSDETVGRYPDGGANIYTMNVPTIAKANIYSSYSLPVEQPAPTGISELYMATTESSATNDAWYTLDGRQLRAQPTKKGLYIHCGRKVVVR